MFRLDPAAPGSGGQVTIQTNPLMPSPPAAAPPGPSQVVHAPFPSSLVGNRPGAPVPVPGGLPGLIVRVGPPGGVAARAHLDAGHSSDTLIEAAANSLAAAAMVGGRLDPARYEAWLQQRVQFLREIPNADALFGSVEAAAHTIAAIMGQNRSVGSAVGGGQQQPQQPQQPGQPSRPPVETNALLPLVVSAAASRNPRPRR